MGMDKGCRNLEVTTLWRGGSVGPWTDRRTLVMGVAGASQGVGKRIKEVFRWVKTAGGGHMFVINCPSNITLLQHMDRGPTPRIRVI